MHSKIQKNLHLVWIVIITSLVILFSFQIYQYYNASSFPYDDNYYMSETNNLLHGRGFTVNVIYPLSKVDPETGVMQDYASVNSLIDHYPNLNWNYSRAPMFFIFLASFFAITKANPSNWVTYASIFNTIVSIFLGIAYFIFVRRYFGTLVGIFSSVIIITSLIFIMGITTAEPNQLTYLFIVLSLLFLNKTKNHYILFGIFAALANLTNEFGIIPIVSYGAYLLFKREYKGLAIVVIIWLTILTPWMIRDFYAFHDFGSSLGIPFSSQISSLFGSSRLSGLPIQYDIIPHSESPLIDSPFKLIYDFFAKNPSHTELIKFIIPFLFISYLSISKLTNKISKRNFLKFAGIIAIITSMIITYQYATERLRISTSTNNIIQILIILSIIIPFVIYHKRAKNSSIFEFPIPRSMVVLGFVVGVSILALYYGNILSLQINDFVGFPLMFVGLPLGIFGIKKIIDKIPKLKQGHKTIIICALLTTIIVLSPTFNLNSPFFVPNLNLLNSWGIEDYGMDKEHAWIRNNIKSNAVLVYDPPSILFIRTGNPVITFPDELKQEHLVPLIWYFAKYNATYIVFDIRDNDLKNNLEIIGPLLSDWLSFKSVYSQDNNEIWKIGYSDQIFSNPIHRAVELEKQGRVTDAIKIYNDQDPNEIVKTTSDFTRAYLMLYQLGANLGDSAPIKISQFTNSTQNSMKSRSMLVTKLLDRINTIMPDINGTLRSLRLAEDTQNYDEVINGYNKLSNDLITIRYVVVQSSTDTLDKYYLKTLDDRLYALKIIEYGGKYDIALKGYNQILLDLEKYEKLSPKYSQDALYQYYFDTYAGKIRIYKNLYVTGEIYDSQIREEYDNTYQLLKHLIKIKNGEQKSDMESMYLRLIDSEIKYWQDRSNFEFMHDVYTELTSYDQFNKEGWLGLATTAEKIGNTQEAIVDYQYYLKLVGNSTESGKIQEKIDQLTKELGH